MAKVEAKQQTELTLEEKAANPAELSPGDLRDVRMMGAVMAESQRLLALKSVLPHKTPGLDQTIPGGKYIVDGVIVGSHGKLIDEHGNLVNGQGQPIDEYGRLLGETERLSKTAPRPIPGGGYVDANGVMVNVDGVWVDANGNVSSSPIKATV